MAQPESPARVVRTGPPVAITVKVTEPVCSTCGARLVLGRCPKGCQRVERMDRTEPRR